MTTYNNISWLPKDSRMEIIFQEDKEILTTAVFCFVLSEDKKWIYLMDNANRERGLDIPGGHIDPGETSIQALHREVLEEIGVTIKNISYVGSQKIIKTVVEEKYPELISCQTFYVATIQDIVTDKLEKDSLSMVRLSVNDFKAMIKDKEDCYYKELYLKAISSSKEELYKEPSEEVLRDACLSYRHDFGLLSEEEQKRLIFEAKEWDLALHKAKKHFRNK